MDDKWYEAEDLMEFKSWVVAGNVMEPYKYAFRIMNALIRNGYNVHGLHPLDIHEDVARSFSEIKDKVDVLNLCVNPERGIEIVKDARAHGVDKVLAQPGARSSEIEEYCRNNGMSYVEGCTLVELGKL